MNFSKIGLVACVECVFTAIAYLGRCKISFPSKLICTVVFCFLLKMYCSLHANFPPNKNHMNSSHEVFLLRTETWDYPEGLIALILIGNRTNQFRWSTKWVVVGFGFFCQNHSSITKSLSVSSLERLYTWICWTLYSLFIGWSYIPLLLGMSHLNTSPGVPLV